MSRPITTDATESVVGRGPHEVVPGHPHRIIHVFGGVWLSDMETVLKLRAGGVVVRFLKLCAGVPERWPDGPSAQRALVAEDSWGLTKTCRLCRAM